MKVALVFLLAKLFLVVSVHFSSATDFHSPCLPATDFHSPCLPEDEILQSIQCFEEDKPSSKQKPAVPTITRMKDDDYCFVPKSSVASQIKENIPVIARSIVALTIAKILVDRKMDNLFNQILKYAQDSKLKEKTPTPSKSNRQQ